MLAVEYLRRQHVPLAVSPPAAGPHEAPLCLHAGSRDVDCVKLDTSGPQHRDNGLLLCRNLYALTLDTRSRNAKYLITYFRIARIATDEDSNSHF